MKRNITFLEKKILEDRIEELEHAKNSVFENALNQFGYIFKKLEEYKEILRTGMVEDGEQDG